jgi:hypothetical protein
MTARYAHLSPDHLKNAVKMIAQRTGQERAKVHNRRKPTASGTKLQAGTMALACFWGIVYFISAISERDSNSR